MEYELKQKTLEAVQTALQIVTILLIAVMVATCLPEPAQASERQCSTYPSDDILNRVKLLKSKYGSGSMFEVNENWALSATHVIDQMPAIVRIGTKEDITAIMAPSGVYSASPSEDFPMTTKLEPKQKVWAVGWESGVNLQVSRGVVVLKNPDGLKVMLSTVIHKGMSGGPLLVCEDGEFKVAGVLHGFTGFRTPFGIINALSSIAIAIPQEWVKE